MGTRTPLCPHGEPNCDLCPGESSGSEIKPRGWIRRHPCLTLAIAGAALVSIALAILVELPWLILGMGCFCLFVSFVMLMEGDRLPRGAGAIQPPRPWPKAPERPKHP